MGLNSHSKSQKSPLFSGSLDPPSPFFGTAFWTPSAPHHHTRWCGRRCWATIGCIINYSARSILLECVGLGTANAEARSHQMRQAGKENCPHASLFVSLVCLTPDLNSARRAGHGHATGSIPRPLDKNSVCGRPPGARRPTVAGGRPLGRANPASLVPGKPLRQKSGLLVVWVLWEWGRLSARQALLSNPVCACTAMQSTTLSALRG
jgi:hypothetical protein